MKKMTLTFFLAATLCSVTFAQHIMDVIGEDFANPPKSLVHDNRLYVPHQSTLKVYTGEVFEDFSLPVFSGARYMFSEDIFSLSGALYISMYNDLDIWAIARFNGGTFSTFRLPYPLASNVMVFRGLAYMMLQTSTGLKLYTYNGAVLNEIVSLIGTGHGKLHIGGSYLYIETNSSLRRYNGSSWGLIPVPSAARDITKVFQIGTSSSAYLIMHDVLYHYNGVTLTEVYRHPYELGLANPVMWNSSLYFRYYTGGTYPERLYRCTGTSLSEVSIPAGASFSETINDGEITLYRDRLYMPFLIGDETVIYRYDGAAWESVYNWGERGYAVTIKERRGKLVFYRVVNDRIIVEYDGVATFESFGLPPGISWTTEPRGTTACYHLWMTGRVEDYEHKWTFVKETFDSLCVTPSPGSASVIPANLGEFDRFDIGNRARERDWCWTGIDIDWDITPICITPPCAPPRVQTTLVDKAGKIAWQKIFDKPFSSSFLLNDTQPYTLSVSIERDKKFGGVLLLDKDLVNKGVEDLSLDFHPKEDYFRLTVATDKQKQVPMIMALRNTAGASLWQKKFIAPFDDVVSAYVPKAGDYLQFSLQTQPKSITYFPNPFNGKLNFTLEDSEATVRVSVSDMNGKVIAQKQLKASTDHSIDMTGQKSGLYILTISDGNSTRRELIQLRE